MSAEDFLLLCFLQIQEELKTPAYHILKKRAIDLYLFPGHRKKGDRKWQFIRLN
jgi:hypothetical protein